MSYHSLAIDELFFVRWLSGTPADLDAVARAVHARRLDTGRPLIYVSIEDGGTEDPDEKFIRHMLSLAPDFFDRLARVYLVVALPGLAGNIHRRLLRAGLATARTIDPRRAKMVSLVESMSDLFADLGFPTERRDALERTLTRGGVWPRR